MTFRLRWSSSLPFSPGQAPRAGHPVLCHDYFGAAALDSRNGTRLWSRSLEAPEAIDWLLPHPQGAVLCQRRDDMARLLWLDHGGQERFSKALEGWGSEAIVVGEELWLLRGTTLARLGPDGSTVRTWKVPEGAVELRDADGVRFRVPEDGLYRMDESTGRVVRAWKGAWDGFLVQEGWTVAWNSEVLAVRNPRGRGAWERRNPGQMPALGAHLFGTFREAGEWKVLALERDTGEVRWSVAREGQDEHGVLIPAGRWVGLWRLGPVEMLDARTGEHVQMLEPPGDWFSAAGSISYRDGLLVLAADDQVLCYEET